MQVLWFANSPCNYKVCGGFEGVGYNGGGWMTSLQDKIEKCDDIKLGICFVMDNQPSKIVQNNVVYYPVATPAKSVKERIRGYLKYRDLTVDKAVWSYYIEKFKDVIKDFRPDVIHLFGSELYMGLACFASEVPCVLHIQGTLNPYREVLFPPGLSKWDYTFMDWNPKGIFNRYFEILWWDRNCYRERAILKKVKHYIGRTEWDKRTSYVLNPQRRYHFGEEIMRDVFYHPFERKLPNELIISTVISFPFYKGYDIILKTASILKNDLGLDFEWNVYGNVDPIYIEKRLGIKHQNVNVNLRGVVSASEIRKIHSVSTLYYHSAYIENGCNAIIEAQMCGCTPIVNYVGGLSDTVHDKKTGFWVPANDSYQSAFLIKWLYEHPEDNIRIGKQAALDAFSRHNPKDIVDNIIRTYRNVINDI